MFLGMTISACNANGESKSTPQLTSKVENIDNVVIVLERTMCFGMCPAYSLVVAGNGTVIYEGRYYVKVEGWRTATISQEKVKELISEFERVNFFSLKNYYADDNITDRSSAITSITIGEKTKTVIHYSGNYSQPKELIELENKIDEITNSAQWTGK